MADMQAMTIRLDRDVYEKLRQIAYVDRTSMNAIIAEALTAWLEDK